MPNCDKHSAIGNDRLTVDSSRPECAKSGHSAGRPKDADSRKLIVPDADIGRVVRMPGSAKRLLSIHVAVQNKFNV